MSQVKIGVGADAGGVAKAIDQITASMNKMGASVAQNQKLKFEPTDVKTMARDLELVNKQFQQALSLSAQLRNALKATGQQGKTLSQVDFSKLSTNPQVAQRIRDRAFLHSVRGTALDPTLANEVDAGGNIIPTAPPTSGAGSGRLDGGRYWGARRDRDRDREESNTPGRRIGRVFGKTASSFSSGVGGPVGSVANEAIDGAASGGATGMVGGVIAGALAAGAMMAGKMISEGIDQAKERNLGIDMLKRSIGDLGVSFENLSEVSWKSAVGLGMANTEFVKMEALANSQSGGLYRSPEDLGEATRSGVGLARAYGLDPSQGVGFVAGMDRTNNHQNNKELAAVLAEAIVNTQGKALPAEVMQAMQSLAAGQNRFNSGNVDLNRFGNAFSGLLGTDGMTADHASSILGQANGAMQQMGGSEAARNFTLRAFGGLDPIRSAIRAEGGLYGNGLDDRHIAAYMGAGWNANGTGPVGTNFSLINKQFDRDYAGRGQFGREMELDAQKNYWRLNSYADTARFVGLGDSDHNGVMDLLKNAGVGLGDVREGGIATLASIHQAGSFGALKSLYGNDIRGRDDLSDADKDRLDKSEKGGNFQEFQNELVRTLAGKGQSDDDATTQRAIDANISDMKTDIGSKLIPATNAIMGGVLFMAQKLGYNAPGATTGSGAPMGFDGSVSRGPIREIPYAKSDAEKIASDTGDVLASTANDIYGKGVGKAYSYRDSVTGAMAQLGGLGIDKAHAAAIVANAIGESSMEPGASNGKDYGLFQLDPARQKDFQKVMGKSVIGSSAADQIAYMVKSMQPGGEEGGRANGFWASSGPNAARVFATDIERVDHPGMNGDIRAGIASELDDTGQIKIPFKHRGTAAAGDVGAITAASRAEHQGDIVINLEQHNTSAIGATKTSRISTTIAKPSSSGTTPKVYLPGSN